MQFPGCIQIIIKCHGYVGDDNLDSIDVLPVISCAATPGSCVGKYIIYVDSAYDNNYSFKYTQGTLCINKRSLCASVLDTTKVYGEPTPDFTIIYNEFVGNDNIDSLNTPPITHCDADEFTDVGQVVVTLTEGSDNNYDISCKNGTLFILKADQEIRFDSIYPVKIGIMPFELIAYATSGLKIEYSSSNPDVAFISGNMITVMHAGTTVISANQPGNKNYNAAGQVQHGLLVQESTWLDRKEHSEFLVFPNPASDELYIMNKSGYIKQIVLYNAFGSSLIKLRCTSNYGKMDITNLANGIYMLEIISDKTSHIIKVLVNNIR